jgi:pyroglutamyl-peptidase
MNKILVTGFGAFLQHEVNPAEKIALALKKEGYDIVILPVSYDGAHKAFDKIPNLKQYDIILSFGLASSRPFISLEKMAYNEMNAIHLDNDGVRKMGELILPDRPPYFSTTIDAMSLKESLEKQNIRIEISTDPGRYICNEVYYLDLASGIPSLFVHFPDVATSSIENDYAAAEIIVHALEDLKLGA